MFTRSSPIFDSSLGRARFCVVVREQFWQSACHLRDLIFQFIRHAGMQLLALAAQEACIRCALNERVLGSVYRMGRRAAGEDETRLGERRLFDNFTALARLPAEAVEG